MTKHPLRGDVEGSPFDNVVRRIFGRSVSSSAPTNGDVLVWNSVTSQWEPSSETITTPPVTGLLPPGGTTGALLVKLSDADYDAGWLSGAVTVPSSISIAETLTYSTPVTSETITATTQTPTDVSITETLSYEPTVVSSETVSTALV